MIQLVIANGFLRSQRTAYAENLEHLRPVFHRLSDG